MAFFFLSDSFMQQEHGKVRVGQRRQGRGGQSGQQRQEGGRTRAGQGRAGQGRAGPGRAGQGRAGQGRAGQGQKGSLPKHPWSRGEPAPVPGGTWVLPFLWLWKPGKRIGSLCAIEVEGLKRRPPTEVSGLSLEFRVKGFRVQG